MTLFLSVLRAGLISPPELSVMRLEFLQIFEVVRLNIKIRVSLLFSFIAIDSEQNTI